MKTLAIAFVMSLSCVAAPVFSAPVSTGQVVIGTTSLSLAPPAGFVDVTGLNQHLTDLGRFATPPSNRLLALILIGSDAIRVAAGQPPLMERYLVAQTLRQHGGMSISPQEFAMVRKTFREQAGTMLESITPNLQSEFEAKLPEARRRFQDPTLRLKLGESRAIRLFNETPSTIGLSALTNYTVTTDGVARESTTALSMTIALLRGKIVYLYVYSRYRTQADVDWTEAMSQRWLMLLAAANPGN